MPIRTINHSKRIQKAAQQSDSSPKLSEWISKWLHQLKCRNAKRTYENAEMYCRLNILPYLGNKTLAELQVDQGWAQKWMDRIIREAGSKKTVPTNAKRILSRCFNAAIRQGVMRDNPMKFVVCQRHPKEEIVPFTKEEVKGILEVVGNRRCAALFHLAFKLGMRIGELLGLQWRDIDFAGRKITLRRQRVSRQLKSSELKTRGSKRTLPMDAALLAACEHRRTWAEKELRSDPNHYVFMDVDGTPLNSSAVDSWWKVILRDCGLKHRGFHHTRHTMATLMLQADTPIQVVSKLLGHSRVSITYDFYSHYLPTDGYDALAKLNSYLGE